MTYEGFLIWLRELEDSNNNNQALVTIIDRLYERFLQPFEDDIFNVIANALAELQGISSLVYPTTNAEMMLQRFAIPDNKEEFRATYLEEESYNAYSGNTFLRHFQSIITQLNYFKHPNNEVFAKQDIVRLFQNAIPTAIRQENLFVNPLLIKASTEPLEVSSQILKRRQALEDAKAIREFMVKASKVFGKKFLAASKLVGWPNKDIEVTH